MAKDIRIIPGDGEINFTNAAGVAAGSITLSGDDLVLSNALGNVLFGDVSSDVYIGDGINNVDIIFEKSGEIRAETGVTGVTLTIGSSNTTVTIVDPDLTGSPTAPTAAAGTNTTQIATTAFVSTAVSNLVDSAPGTLNTLNELAAALGDDASFSTTVSTALGNRLRVDTASQNLTATEKSNARTNLGLGSAATSASTDFAAASHTHAYLPLAGGTMTGPLRIQEGASDQSTSSDSASIPSTTGAEFMKIEGGYTNGQYTHELAKIDRGGNLPLYVRQSKGTANSFSNIARFGSHSYSGHEFEVFGSIKASGGDSSQWNTAYGWGNHSGLYATSDLATGTSNGLMSSTDKEKLDGIDSGANNYSLPLGTSTTRGGFKVGYTESGKNYPVELSNEQMYVNVPWTDTDTTYSTATSTTLGLVKIGYTENGKNYPVELSSGQMFVNVPWTDTNTTYSVATTTANGLMSSTDKSKLDGIAASANNYSLPLGTSTARGGFKIGYTESGKNYPVELSNEQMYVNVPWTDTDTDTTYSAGTGLSLSGTTFNVDYPVRVLQNQNYAPSDGTSTGNNATNRANFGTGLTIYEGYSTGSNRPFTYDTAAQFMVNANQGFEFAIDWVSGSSTPIKIRSLRDCCQGWSSWSTIWTSSTDGSGSGLDADLLDGNHASAFALSAHSHSDATTSASGFMSSTDKSKLDGIAASANNYSLPLGTSTTRGGFKVGYTESGKNYPVELSNEQMYVNVPWTDTTYNIADSSTDGLLSSGDYDKFSTAFGWGDHASAGYLTSVTNISGYSGTLIREDNRTISPSELTAGQMKFGFTSWSNNNSSPYADFIHLRSYTDSSGGSDNLVMFKKSGIGMRIWQQTYGSTSAYSSYADVYTTSDFATSDFVAVSGDTMTGTLTASGGINGLTLANGGISGSNFNITGVNQLEIADPGEGIVFKAGASGDITLAIIDDTTDNILNLSGTGAKFRTPVIQLNDANTVIQEGANNSVNISTGTGSIDIGSMNASWVHIQADRNIYILPSSGGKVSVDGDLVPHTDNAETLGASGNRWSTIYGVTGAFSGDVVAYSDARVKENVETIETPLDKVMKLRGVSFNRTGEDRKNIGVIAQEIREVLPEVVHEQEDGMLAVAYGNIVGLLIEAMKEQQQQIEELKSMLGK